MSLSLIPVQMSCNFSLFHIIDELERTALWKSAPSLKDQCVDVVLLRGRRHGHLCRNAGSPQGSE